jgi:hypothetical protein
VLMLGFRLDKLAWRKSKVRRQSSHADACIEHELKAHLATQDILFKLM